MHRRAVVDVPGDVLHLFRLLGGERFNMKPHKLLRKLKKVYIKMLSAYARRKLAKAYELEDKAILLELQLKEQRQLVDEIEEGLDALKEKNT